MYAMRFRQASLSTTEQMADVLRAHTALSVLRSLPSESVIRVVCKLAKPRVREG